MKLKNNYINLESILSPLVYITQPRWLINQNRESTYYSEYINFERSSSPFTDLVKLQLEELLLTESIIYLSKQTTSTGNIRYEIADAFVHATGENGHEHFINLIKEEFLKWYHQ